ncbi:MAG: polysaccharide biosynthesis protein, partial [Acidobacteria bacterium]|nr:polysaccharide biosynthesis protein [Acidobacteriota bacterium]
HAAALKHVSLLEQYPEEAWKTNVLGTRNILRAAEEVGVETFINISTDKAVRPKSFMGLSKRLAENVIHEMNERFDTQFATVRFGNVAGSNGSVIPLFRQQIAQGGPVTVTDPRARRFFMSIPEAVRLVLQAAVYSQRGGILVLDMGKPIEIYELAKMMISLAGYLPHVDIPIEFTRLGSGEKLTEELQDEGEELQPTDHNRILAIAPKKFEPVASILQRVPRWQRLVDRGQVSELMDEVFEVWPGLGKGAIKTVAPALLRSAGNLNGLRVN